MNLNYSIQSPLGGLVVQPRPAAPGRRTDMRLIESLPSSPGLQHTDLRKGPHYADIGHEWRIQELERVQSELPSSPVASPKIFERLKAQREQQRVSEEKRKRREAEAHRWKCERKWLAENRDRYRGQWVALDFDRLLAASRDGDEVFAKVQGVKPVPLITFIEDSEIQFPGW